MILNLYNIRVRPALRFVDITIRNLNIIRHNERRPSTKGESELDMNGKHLKLVGLLIIPALLLFAIACGGDTPPDQPAQPEPAAPSQAPAAPSAAGPSAPQSPGAARRPGSGAHCGFVDGSGAHRAIDGSDGSGADDSTGPPAGATRGKAADRNDQQHRCRLGKRHRPGPRRSLPAAAGQRRSAHLPAGRARRRPSRGRRPGVQHRAVIGSRMAG